jgi:hypothetical protein
VTDWFEVLNFILGVVGTGGVLVLVYQHWIDVRSKHPYKFNSLNGAWDADPIVHEVQVNLTIANRASYPATFGLYFGTPLGERGCQDLPDLQVGVAPWLGGAAGSRRIEVPGHSSCHLLIRANLTDPGYRGPLRALLMDHRNRSFQVDYHWGQMFSVVAPPATPQADRMKTTDTP